MHIISKLSNGYSSLQSLVVFNSGLMHGSSDKLDKLTLLNTASNSLTVSGAFADDVPLDDSNTIIKAQFAIEQLLGKKITANWHLQKNVPAGSGLGSASANAAAALRLLQSVYGLLDADLFDIAAVIGADVPVCLMAKNAMIQGIGEQLTPMTQLTTPKMVVVFPMQSLSTKMMFSLYYNENKPFNAHQSMYDMHNIFATENVFQDIAIQQQPVVGVAINALKNTAGCQISRLSGSGSACFGIYKTADDAIAAHKQLKSQHPDWWIFV